jgi:hypothetical protein
MSTVNTSKINQLLLSQPTGAVFTSHWMSRNGYSPELQKRYRLSNWLASIGNGAMKRTGEEITMEGALYSLQNQLGLSVHIGATSALALLGRSQYLQLNSNQTYLFGTREETLPKWFATYPWRAAINYQTTGFLPARLGMTDYETNNGIMISISGQIRAIMECLYLAPAEIGYTECYELLESMTSVRPQGVQKLLEACSSVKVNRMFLFLAEKTGHSWVRHLDQSKLELGSGKRSLAKNGVYIPAYQITVPKELAKDE